jgi:hypothetical protein
MLAADMLPLPKRRAVGDPVALAGLALIGWAIWRFDADTPFPGLNAILPVLGSALVLAGTCAEGSRVARALSFRPLAGIGLISYSLYLWHWPLIVFGGYYVLDPPTLAIVKPAMALLAIPVAWASWRFIELPFRKPRLLMTRRRLFIGAAAVSVALALYGVAIHRLDGVPGRFSPIVRRLSAAQPAPDYGCAGRPIATLLDEPRCRMGDPARPPDFIIWGDSHTAVYLRALDELARRHGESGVLVATLGCVPLDTSGLRGARAKACRARNAEALDWISRVRPRAVVLGGNWTLFEAGVAGRRGVRISVHLGPEYEAAIERQAVRLRALGVAVYFVLDVPQSPSPIELAKARVLGARALSGSFTAEYLRANARTRALAFDLQRRGLLRVIDPGALLCGPWTCRNVEGDAPLYHDRSHLNAAGARLAAPAFEPMFAAAALPPEPR